MESSLSTTPINSCGEFHPLKVHTTKTKKLRKRLWKKSTWMEWFIKNVNWSSTVDWSVRTKWFLLVNQVFLWIKAYITFVHYRKWSCFFWTLGFKCSIYITFTMSLYIFGAWMFWLHGLYLEGQKSHFIKKYLHCFEDELKSD